MSWTSYLTRIIHVVFSFKISNSLKKGISEKHQSSYPNSDANSPNSKICVVAFSLFFFQPTYLICFQVFKPSLGLLRPSNQISVGGVKYNFLWNSFFFRLRLLISFLKKSFLVPFISFDTLEARWNAEKLRKHISAFSISQISLDDFDFHIYFSQKQYL